jgi:hypothetical protein
VGTGKMLPSLDRPATSSFLTTVFRSPLYPDLFRITGLLIYIGLIWFSLGVAGPSGIRPKLVAQNTITSLLVWGVWLPLLVIVTAFFGRIWCSVCPLELVQRIGERIGRSLLGRQLAVPAYLRTGIAGVMIYVVLIFMVIATGFPMVPGNSATLLAGLLLFSLVAGIFFGNRVFCKVFCPADMLLRAFGRRGMLRIRHALSDDPSVNERNGNASLAAMSCPSHLNPKELKDSSPCILCGRCVKANASIYPVFRSMPGVPDDSWKDYGWPITILCFFLSGFVIEHIFHDSQAGKPYYVFLPNIVKKAIGIKELAGWIEAIWVMLIVPGALWISAGIIGKLWKRSLTIADIWKKISLPTMTIVTGLHIILSLKKFSHWITHGQIAFSNFLERVITQPIPDSFFLFRMPTRGRGHGRKFGLQDHLFSESAILILSLIILAIFLFFLYKEICKSKEWSSFVPFSKEFSAGRNE